MKNSIRTKNKSVREQTPDFSTDPAQKIFQMRSLVVQKQPANKSQQPDLQTSLMRAELYGHHLHRMQPAKQLFPAKAPEVIQKKTSGQSDLTTEGSVIQSYTELSQSKDRFKGKLSENKKYATAINRDDNHADINQRMRQAKRYGHDLNKMQPHENKGQSVIQCAPAPIPKDKKKKVRVDPETYNNLEMAKQAIEYTRDNLPYGAGNQTFDIEKSQGESSARTMEAADMDTPSYPEGQWVQERAANAMKCGAGNCDDMGAVAHSFLGMQKLNKPSHYVSQDGFAHTYAMIGDPKDKHSVVADPWPERRQPHLKRHMDPKWQTDLDRSIKKNAPDGGLLYTTPAGGEDGFAEKAEEAKNNPAIPLNDPKAGVKKALGKKRLTEKARSEYVSEVLKEPNIYNQSSSTKDGNNYKYKLDETLTSPADTESDHSDDSAK